MDLEIENVVRQLTQRKIEPDAAAKEIKGIIAREAFGSFATRSLADLGKYIDASCARHYGGDDTDLTIQIEIRRRIKRMRLRRSITPEIEGDIVWIE